MVYLLLVALFMVLLGFCLAGPRGWVRQVGGDVVRGAAAPAHALRLSPLAHRECEARAMPRVRAAYAAAQHGSPG